MEFHSRFGKSLLGMTVGTIFSILAPSLPAKADVVVFQQSFSITGSGGSGGSGTSWSDMIFNTFTAGDGWGWAGGAGGVQGSQSTTNTGGAAIPANETFRFSIGTYVDTWNSLYGAGNWTISGISFSFASSYSVQNNSRFGIGSGTFDIYWVANDNWAQSKGTLTDRGINPIYASSQQELNTWAGSSALLGAKEFTVPGGGSGYVNLTYNLSLDEALLADIYNSSASSPDLTLYLMGTSDTLGMIIFTGGQSQALPTVTFNVAVVPEPAAAALVGLAGLVLGTARLRRRGKFDVQE